MLPNAPALKVWLCTGVNYSNLAVLLEALSFEDGVIALPYFVVARSTSFWILRCLIPEISLFVSSVSCYRASIPLTMLSMNENSSNLAKSSKLLNISLFKSMPASSAISCFNSKSSL